MARNQELIHVEKSYTELTSGSAATMMLQVQEGAVTLRATLPAAPAPGDAEPGIKLRNPDGEWALNLEEFFHLPGARRLWARQEGSVAAAVLVSHEDA